MLELRFAVRDRLRIVKIPSASLVRLAQSETVLVGTVITPFRLLLTGYQFLLTLFFLFQGYPFINQGIPILFRHEGQFLETVLDFNRGKVFHQPGETSVSLVQFIIIGIFFSDYHHGAVVIGPGFQVIGFFKIDVSEGNGRESQLVVIVDTRGYRFPVIPDCFFPASFPEKDIGQCEINLVAEFQVFLIPEHLMELFLEFFRITLSGEDSCCIDPGIKGHFVGRIEFPDCHKCLPGFFLIPCFPV